MSWGTKELQSISFGDARLDNRAGEILTNLGNNPSASIPAASGSWAETKATYNFFKNAKVEDDKILLAHQEEIIKRAKGENILLCPQDTTELDYTGQKKNGAHGLLNLVSRKGTYLHNTIVTTPDRLPLGVLSMETITREQLRNQMNKDERKKHDGLPYEEKESYRWFQAYLKVCELAEKLPNKQVISIGDRENDSYNFIHKVQTRVDSGKPYADFIVRASWDRTLTGDDGKTEKLIYKVAQQDPIAEISFVLPERDGNPARAVTQSVKTKEVIVKATDRKGIAVTAILLTEINPSKECDPVQWLLLTNIKINDKSLALKIVKYYLCRWDIEMFFKVLKSGCKVEGLQLETPDGVKNCLAIYLIVAWRIMYITMLGRSCPDLPCDVVFTEFEWNAVYIIANKKHPPNEIPTLKTIIAIIASLGGFLNRKNDDDPGTKVMWTGMQRMMDMALMLESIKNINQQQKTYG